MVEQFIDAAANRCDYTSGPKMASGAKEAEMVVASGDQLYLGDFDGASGIPQFWPLKYELICEVNWLIFGWWTRKLLAQSHENQPLNL